MLSDADRAAFFALSPHLAAEADPAPVVRFAEERRAEVLEAYGADPGDDHLRAVLLRAAPLLLSGDELQAALEGARRVLLAYPAAVAEGDVLVTVERHPGWVGLAALELGAASAEMLPGGLAEALTLARAGFTVLAGPDPAGEGEVLWAMAELAEEAGWPDRAGSLLQASTEADFSDPAQRERVRLLRAQQLAEQGGTDQAVEMLEDVVGSDDTDDEERVHALLVLADLRESAGDLDRARALLREAHDELLCQGDLERAERVQTFLDVISPAVDED